MSSAEKRTARVREQAKASVVCVTCRSLKKKCDGQVPCSRCVEKGCAGSCQQVVPRKRGRRSREEIAAEQAAAAQALLTAHQAQARATAAFVAESRERESLTAAMQVPIPDGRLCAGTMLALPTQNASSSFSFSSGSYNSHSDVVDMLLAPTQATLLSLLMAYSSRALVERPGDIVTAFGLESLTHGYIAVAVPGRSAYPDVVSAFLHASVVSGGCFSSPRFPDVIFDPRALVGKALHELGPCSDAQTLAELARILSAPAPVEGRPWIRRYRYRKLIMSQFNKLEDVVLENTLFMDPESQYPKWLFVTIVDRIKSSPSAVSPGSLVLQYDNPSTGVSFSYIGDSDEAMPSPRPSKRQEVQPQCELDSSCSSSSSASASTSSSSPSLSRSSREDFAALAGKSAELLFGEGRSALLHSLGEVDDWMIADFSALRKEPGFDFAL